MSVTEAAGTAAKLPLTFACGLYDRMLRLYTGEVQPRGIDLKFLANDEPRDIFDRMGGKRRLAAAWLPCRQPRRGPAPRRAVRRLHRGRQRQARARGARA